jgi:hypothetical protein
MNKKNSVILIIVLSVVSVLASSCSLGLSSYEEELVGIWESSGWYSINFDFNDDGSCRMIGYDVDEQGTTATLNWKADGYHLEITDMLKLYSAAFVYELSADGESLDLYMTAMGIMNTSYDSMVPGNHYTFFKSDATFLTDLE